jgi:Gpi18-like mannosyltransferase
VLLSDPANSNYSAIPTNEGGVRTTGEVVHTDFSLIEPTVSQEPLKSSFWQMWYSTLKNTLPIYISVHLAILVISCFAFLFLTKDLSGQILPVSTFWEQWRHWDTNFYVQIATQGYTNRQEMAFFPLYPLLIRGVMVFARNPMISGILISNIADLILCVVLYRLVEEDFGKERAYSTVLYFSIFPSAFFFSGVYTESLFLCLSILTFYQIRHRNWLLAGLFACFAGLTRPDGVYLTIPFCYAYLSRIWQQQDLSSRAIFAKGQFIRLLKGLRWDVLSGLLFVGGVVLFMAFGYDHFQDILAFVHAHAYWSRHTAFPGWGMLVSAWTILHNGIFSFTSMRNVLSLGTDVFVLPLILLSFVGPWKLPPRLWGYSIYSLVLFIYFQLVPVSGPFPLESMERFLLEIFPAFIILSGLSKYRTFHLSYCMVAGALFFFMLAQFLAGHWIT